MPPKDYERERQTRKQRIDPKLEQAGWSVVRLTSDNVHQYQLAAVEEFPTRQPAMHYALCDGGTALGVVEAKKVTLGPQNVLTQAQRYSWALMPVLRSTRGDNVSRFSTRRMARSFGSKTFVIRSTDR